MDTTFKPPAPPSGSPPRKTLLVVDDEDGPRQSLRVVFKDDYNVLLANDGPSALQLARNQRIDAAVVDIRMVGMSGIELFEHLKANDPAIQVIILTAYETMETARDALRFGACDYLNKPFDLATMRAAVVKAMERRAIAEDIRANYQKLEQLRTDFQDLQLKQEIARTKAEIYACIVHDLGGPLTFISGIVQLINDQVAAAECLEGEDLIAIRDSLSKILTQANQCINIIKRYLQFLRNNRPEDALVQVNPILADIKHLLALHPGSRGHQLVIQPMSKEILVKIKGIDLIQILLNLTFNACQASDQPHRVEIVGSRLDNPLDMSRFIDGPQDRFVNREDFQNTAPLLALAVMNDGPGIPPEIMPKLFESFFTTKSAELGTGLGLFIVRRLVCEAHGAIHLHSEPEQGTRFTVYLPAQ